MRSREKARYDKAVRLARRTHDTGYRPITGYRRIAQAAGSLKGCVQASRGISNDNLLPGGDRCQELREMRLRLIDINNTHGLLLLV